MKIKGRQQSVAFQFSFILDLIRIGVSVIRSSSIKLEPLSCGKVSYERKPFSTAGNPTIFVEFKITKKKYFKCRTRDGRYRESVKCNAAEDTHYLARDRLLLPWLEEVGVLAEAEAPPSEDPRPSDIFPSLLSGASFRFSAIRSATKTKTKKENHEHNVDTFKSIFVTKLTRIA
jgi:hypothetical protein